MNRKSIFENNFVGIQFKSQYIWDDLHHQKAGLHNNDRTDNDVLILSDSLGRNIRNIYETKLLFFQGCTINALAHNISAGEVDIANYTYIVLLIGTNDLAPKEVWKFYKTEKWREPTSTHPNTNTGTRLFIH